MYSGLGGEGKREKEWLRYETPRLCQKGEGPDLKKWTGVLTGEKTGGALGIQTKRG